VCRSLLSVPPFLLQLAMKWPVSAASKKRFYLPGRLYRSVVFMRTWRLCRCLCEPVAKASLSLKVKLDLIEISSLELAVRANDSTIARRR